MVGDTGVAAALLGLVILELLLINFVYMIMLQNAHIPAKAIPGFNSSHEYLSASRSPLFKPPSGDKVVELFRTLGGVWKFRKGDQDGDVHAEVFPSSYLGCDMTVNEASH